MASIPQAFWSLLSEERKKTIIPNTRPTTSSNNSMHNTMTFTILFFKGAKVYFSEKKEEFLSLKTSHFKKIN